MIRRALVEIALPLVCYWAKGQEKWISRAGLPLSAAQLADARQIGITQPSRVRILEVVAIPPETHPALQYLAGKFGMSFCGTIGMALGYGLFICRGYMDNRALIVHELAHVQQFERLGRRAFLRQYLHECLSLGYPQGALEVEARDVAAAICA